MYSMDSQLLFTSKKIKCQKLVLCETEPILFSIYCYYNTTLLHYESAQFVKKTNKQTIQYFSVFQLNFTIFIKKEQHTLQHNFFF